MSVCSSAECNNQTHGDFEECILHCSKKELDFFRIRSDFYNALEKYVNEQTIDSNKFCHFFGIAFPKPDVQSSINYIKILTQLKQIHFDNCQFFTSHLDLKSIEIFFQDCIFHKNWTLYNYKILTNIDDVIYQGCKFLDKVDTCTSDNTWLYKYSHSQFDYTCTFKNDIAFYRAAFMLSPFKGNQDNYKNNTFYKLLIDKCEFEIFEITLQNQINGEIEFNNSTIKSKLKIRNEESGTYEEQRSNKAKLKSLKIIDCNINDNAYLRIGYMEIGDFHLSNLRNPQNSELNIGDCHFCSFCLTNFRNIGRLKLYKINVFEHENGSLFQIDNTSIGDTDFQSIRLTSFTTVRLFDNLFHNIHYTNMQWKETIEVGEFNENGITEIAKKRDTYRILKNVAQANNDQPQALIYYAKEMQHHKSLVIENRCRPSNPSSRFKDFFCKSIYSEMKEGRLSDIVTLIFNETTNNFGLNWWQPVKLILLLTGMFYLLLLLSLNTSVAFDLWKHVFVFINPAHSVEFIAKNHWTGKSYFIDFTYRVLEGLLIYQTIVAFRKFTKK